MFIILALANSWRLHTHRTLRLLESWRAPAFSKPYLHRNVSKGRLKRWKHCFCIVYWVLFLLLFLKFITVLKETMLHYRLASQIDFRVLTEFGRLLRFCCLSSWMWLTYCVEFSYISAVLLSYIFVVDDDNLENWVGECTLHPRCNKAEAWSAFIWIGWGWTLQVMLWIFDLSTAKGTETNISVLLVTGDRGTEQFVLAPCVLPIVHILDIFCFLGLR